MKKDISTYVFWAYLVVEIFCILNFRPSFFLWAPILVSAVVMYLQSKVNRFAFAVCAFNAILYTVAYIQMSLYATALYAILVSFPLQLTIFFNWTKHTNKQKTELRYLSSKKRITLLVGMLAGWLILYIIFKSLHSQYLLFDNFLAILGLVCTVLCALRYKDYIVLQIFNNIISLCLYLMMLKDDPSKIIWLISATYATICSSIAFYRMRKNH